VAHGSVRVSDKHKDTADVAVRHVPIGRAARVTAHTAIVSPSRIRQT